MPEMFTGIRGMPFCFLLPIWKIFVQKVVQNVGDPHPYFRSDSSQDTPLSPVPALSLHMELSFSLCPI